MTTAHPTRKVATEAATIGTDSITLAVLPAATTLTATSNTSWLTITGTGGGALSFSYSANTNVNSRKAQITILGQAIAVTQNGDVGTSITKTAGTGQSTQEGHAFASTLQVRIKDAAGNGVQGVPVTFNEYSGADHEEAIAPFETAALAFLEDLFTGGPAPNGCASIGDGNSLALLPVAPAGSGGSGAGPAAGASCPVVTGSLHGTTLGLVRLGMTRAQARHAYSHSSNRGRRYEDFFCLTPIGVRVGYASPKLLGRMPRRRRGRYRGRIVWASTSDVHFAVDGVRPGTTVRAARRMIHHLGTPFEVGLNDWYLARIAGATAVLKVRHGVVEEIGIADLALTRTRAADRIFVHSFY